MTQRDLEDRSAVFDPDTTMYHGTAADTFTEFHSFRPAFFTSNRNYAAVYMEKGAGRSRIIEATLDVRRPFIGRSPEDVAFWNDGFVPWLKGRYPDMASTLRPIEPRDSIPFIWADEFFVYLRRTDREGTSTYDGMIVDESATEASVEGRGITVVPLHVSQITILPSNSTKKGGDGNGG